MCSLDRLTARRVRVRLDQQERLGIVEDYQIVERGVGAAPLGCLSLLMYISTAR